MNMNLVLFEVRPVYHFIIRPLGNDETRVGEALSLALLVSAAISGLLLGGSLLGAWTGRKRTKIARCNR
jgi:hypothetical protein